MTTHATPPVLGIPGATPELAATLRGGLERVDALLREVVDHDDPFIAQASGHLLEAGGKRFRPLLTLLAAELGEGINDDVVRAAAGVELTHLAGLGAEAVLIQAQTFVRLCAGQIRDDRACPEGVDPVDYYLGVLADKTGVLIATAGRYGVMFSGGSPGSVEIMRSYGEKLGIAFQLADDLIDIASDADDSGKIPGTDLREGVDTLAVLRFRAMADRDDPADARLLEL